MVRFATHARVVALVGIAALSCRPAAAADWRSAGGELFATRPAPAAVLTARPATSPPSAPITPFREDIALAAERSGIDPKLLAAVIAVESAFRADAVSPAGAAGLTQLMPAAAQEMGVADRFDPKENLRGGAEYLSRQMRRFNDVRLAVAAFYAGPSRVARLGAEPADADVRGYVDAVVTCFLALTAGRAVQSRSDCEAPGGPR